MSCRASSFPRRREPRGPGPGYGKAGTERVPAYSMEMNQAFSTKGTRRLSSVGAPAEDFRAASPRLSFFGCPLGGSTVPLELQSTPGGFGLQPWWAQPKVTLKCCMPSISGALSRLVERASDSQGTQRPVDVSQAVPASVPASGPG